MAYELREGQGTLFKNNRKTEDKHPDYTGSIKLPDGEEHWLSAWLKTGQSGTKFLSVAIGRNKRQDHQRERPADIAPPMGNAPAAPRPTKHDDMSDEIPF